MPSKKFLLPLVLLALCAATMPATAGSDQIDNQLNAARAAIEKDDFDKAASILKQALKINPARPGPHALLGYLDFKRDRRLEARQEVHLSQTLKPKTATDLDALGLATAEDKDLNTGLECLTKAIAEEPSNARFYIDRASVNLNAGNHKQALQDSLKAISLDHKNPSAFAVNALVHAYLRDYKAAKESATKAIELRGNAEDFASRGAIAQSDNHPKDAIADFTKSLNLKSRADIYAELSSSYLNVGDADKALSGCEAGLRIKQKDKLMRLRALALLKKNKSLEALNQLDELRTKWEEVDSNEGKASEIEAAAQQYALSTFPADQTKRFSMTALSNLKSGRSSQSREPMAQQLLALPQPKRTNQIMPEKLAKKMLARAECDKAFRSMRAFEYEEALKTLDGARKLAPDLALTYFYKGLCLESMGKKDQAITEYQTAIALDPAQVASYIEAAQTLSANGQYTAALSLIDKGLHYYSLPTNAKDDILSIRLWDFYRERATNDLLLNRGADACKDINQAINLNPYFKKLYNIRAQAYCKTGEYQKALADVDFVIDDKESRVHINQARALQVEKALDLKLEILEKLGKVAEAHMLRQEMKSLEKDLFNKTPFFNTEIRR